MCVAEAITAGASIASGAVGMAQSNAENKFKMAQNRQKQFVHRRLAANAITQGREAGQQVLQANAQQRAAQRVSFAKSGVSAASGSASRALQDMVQLGRANAQQSQFQGQSQAAGQLQSIHDLRSDNALIKSRNRADKIQGSLGLLKSGASMINPVHDAIKKPDSLLNSLF